MIVSCPNCGAKYQYDEGRFGDSLSKKLKCSKCAKVFEVVRPVLSEAEAQATHIKGSRKVEDTTKQHHLKRQAEAEPQSNLPELAPLPGNLRYSLAVILGANAGQIYQVTKPRVVLGRGVGSDIQLQDSEISRRHAMIEIRGEQAAVTDLGSTNGLFVDGVRVERGTIESHQEFGLGSTKLMFIVTEAPDMAHD